MVLRVKDPDFTLKNSFCPNTNIALISPVPKRSLVQGFGSRLSNADLAPGSLLFGYGSESSA